MGEHTYVIWSKPKNKKSCIIIIIFINNEPILTSTLAAGIVQDMFAREAGEGEGGEEEMTGGYFYRSSWKFFLFLALEYLSQNTNTRMRIRNVGTYTYIHV